MRRIVRLIRKLLIVSCFIVVIAAAGYFVLNSSGNTQQQFITQPVERGNIKQVVTANGTLNPTVVAEIGTQVSGQVTKLYVGVNDEVKEGQLIAEIDPQLLEAQLKRSKSSLEIARINYEQSARDHRRNQQLFKKDYIAKVEVERSQQALMSQKLSYESAKAQVESDEVNLSYTQIKSPIDGVVIAAEVTEGQTVAASLQTPTLFKIAASLVDMKIDVTVTESDVGSLEVGMPVTFTVDAYPNREFSGTLASININPNGSGQLVVTYSAVVKLKNEDRALFPGMTAYSNITLEEKQGVLKVPAVALRFKPPKTQESGIKNLFDPSTRYRRWRSQRSANQGQSIFLLRDGQPVEVSVQTGMIDERNVEIISEEVKEGDEVITGLVRQDF